MKRSLILLCAISAVLLSGPAFSAMNTDPDWPCVQRKVPELSLAQIWQGPELPASANDWDADSRIADIVAEVAARKVPLDEARKMLDEYAVSVPSDQRKENLLKVFQGLFDKLNGERQQVITGISHYAHKQRDLADDLRKRASEVDKLRADKNADPDDVERQSEKLTWETRIFEERVQSLTYVCEVPTIIEQRLYNLSKHLEQLVQKN